MARSGIRSSMWGPRKSGYKKYNRRRTKYKGRYRKAVAAEVKRVLNGRTGGYVGLEKKFFDSERSIAIPVSTDASGCEADPTTLLCLNCPAQGDGESERDGRQISMSSIQVKGMVSIAAQSDQTAGDVIPDVMIALVLDKQTNGSQLNSEDVYENPSGFSTLASQPFRNLENSQRFRVLKTVHVTSTELAGAIQPVYDGTNIEQQGANVPFSMYVNLKGMKVNFISGQTSSTISAIADNSIHVIAYASNVSASPTLLYNARLRFVG